MVNLVLRRLLRRGLWDGLVGGSRFWLMAGGMAAVIRVVKRLGGSQPRVVYSEKLEPGQTLVISQPAADR